MRYTSPIWWARWNLISRSIAQTIAPLQPAILVLSLPRSGSSWVAETLGSASDALYLREPVTQSNKLFYDRSTIFALDDPELETAYRRLADRAFLGWPDFGSHVIRFPEQWALRRRRSRRVIIKEVNPLAGGWYMRRYQPRIVLLLRHPGAIAESFQRMGWLGAEPEDWAANGELQGRALRAVFDMSDSQPACKTVHYEALCASPLNAFRDLFTFAHLTWDAQVETFISMKTSGEAQNDAWNTARNSRLMIDAWRSRVSSENLSALRNAYRQFDLPWYQADREW